jgi:uncharacterized repeat protein (TIGR02059 family)
MNVSIRNLLCLIFLVISPLLSATTYYISPTGNDASGTGTISSPWFSLERAWTAVFAGDIIYVRGGTYAYTNSQRLYYKNGTTNNRIQILNYQNEKPIFDYSGYIAIQTDYGLFAVADYVTIKGLRITGLPQTSATWINHGFYLYQSNNWIIEQCEVDHIGGCGFVLENSSNVLFLNCDVHNCIDPLTEYNQANGFSITSSANTSTNITFRGCRSWMNSDDGYDFFGLAGSVVLDSCWAFWTGYDNNFNIVSTGNGFKLGPSSAYVTTNIRTLNNCLSFENTGNGFLCNNANHPEGHDYESTIYNSVAYRNGLAGESGNQIGFNFWDSNVANNFKNNIDFANLGKMYILPQWISTNNSWNGGVSVADNDFISLSSTGLDGPRQSDGSLPVSSFLQLATGSDLIDKGVDVGLPYGGSAPDLGAYEIQITNNAPNPLYVSSAIENATASRVEMTYDLFLANIVPNLSAFTVMVNSVVRTINSITISGTKVFLTLSSPIVYGDIVTVAYTKPSISPLQTSAGGMAASLSTQTVTNKVAAPVPVYISSAIENATPSIAEITYNMNLANISPVSSSFTVLVNSVARSINSVSISGTKVMLTLASPVIFGEIVSVAYTKPAGNPLQTPAGGQAASISSQTVTNKVSAPIPVFVSSSVENATPSRVDLAYSMALVNIIPAVSSFTVLVNSVSRGVNSVSISGTNVFLTLSSPVLFGESVTVAYVKPASNQLQTTAGGQAASIVAQIVTNKVSAPIPVFVSSTVENATPSRVDLVYNLALANIVPAASSFTVLVNSVARTVNSVSISGTNVLLTLSSPVLSGESVNVAYTKPSANPLQTSSGGLAATISAQTVTNRVSAPGIPMYVNSALENATPSKIDITYSLALASLVPAASSFTVLVNSVARTVSSVAVSGTKVTLTLANPVVYGDAITVAYTKPASNQLQTTSGGQAYTISAQTVKNNVSPPNPVYTSSVVENASPSKLEITYNLALANIVPAASSFTVLVNSAARTVSSAAISGTTVQLMLATAVGFGDVITVAYAKPASNPVQTASGGQAAAFTAQSVTNRVSAIPVPLFTGAGVENATPTVIELYYSLALANIIPSLSSFTVKVNSVTKNVIAVSITGSKVLLTVSNGIIAEDNVTVSYTKPAANPLQTPAGGMAATFGAQQVANKVSANGPVYVSSVIENTAPRVIRVTYNEVLNPSAPGVSAFLVLVNGVNRPIVSVSINGNTVILLLESRVSKGDVVTVSYTKPAGNPLQKATGGPAVSIGPQPVTNNVQDLTVVSEIRKGIISIYPNPARDFINFSTREVSSESHIIRIFDFSGKLCLETRIDPLVDNLRIPINLRSGVYVIHVIIGSITVFTHKLLVNN